jgi:hypothetical protein
MHDAIIKLVQICRSSTAGHRRSWAAHQPLAQLPRERPPETSAHHTGELKQKVDIWLGGPIGGFDFSAGGFDPPIHGPTSAPRARSLMIGSGQDGGAAGEPIS